MTEQVLETIRRFQMLSPDDHVVVGVSGGADSMSLLHLLWNLREKWPGLQVTAAHVNHCLRGEEADRDEAFVRAYCQEKGIPFEVLKTDVKREAALEKIGLEECGRKLRYGFFETLAGETGKIATAHTLSDLTETVLLHLARGTGLRGLCGMPPVRGKVIRPLIDCTRQEIEAYCAENQISYVTDSTNLTELYARNKIRLQVIPALKSVNPNLEAAVGRMASSLREDADYLEQEARRLLSEAAAGRSFSRKVLLTAEKPVRIRAIRKIAEGKCSPETRHLQAIDQLLLAGTGGVSVPGGFDFKVKEGRLTATVHKKRRIPQ